MLHCFTIANIRTCKWHSLGLSWVESMVLKSKVGKLVVLELVFSLTPSKKSALPLSKALDIRLYWYLQCDSWCASHPCNGRADLGNSVCQQYLGTYELWDMDIILEFLFIRNVQDQKSGLSSLLPERVFFDVLISFYRSPQDDHVGWP